MTIRQTAANVWTPTLAETFVFHDFTKPEKTALVIVPGGQQPATLVIDGSPYAFDSAATEKTRMYIRVHLEQHEKDLGT